MFGKKQGQSFKGIVELAAQLLKHRGIIVVPEYIEIIGVGELEPGFLFYQFKVRGSTRTYQLSTSVQPVGEEG